MYMDYIFLASEWNLLHVYLFSLRHRDFPLGKEIYFTNKPREKLRPAQDLKHCVALTS